MSDTTRLAAFRALARVETDQAHIDRALDAALGSLKIANPRDRRFAAELVFGAVRYRRALDAIVAAATRRPAEEIDPPACALLRLGLYQALAMDRTPASAAVNESVEIAKRLSATRHLAGFVNGALRGALRLVAAKKLTGKPLHDIVRALAPKPRDEAEALGLIHSFPDWLARRWIKTFGRDTAERIMRDSNRRAPVFLRVNRLKPGAQDRLAKSDMELEPVPGEADFMLVRSQAPAPGARIIDMGFAQPQDLASHRAASLLAPPPGAWVADVCCGRGVKTGQFAAAMNNRGRILCLDRGMPALEELSANMERLGVAIHLPARADAAQPWPTRRRFDFIFLDAPCSGTGVLRRKPEGKWNRGESLVMDMARVQQRSLDQAALALAPGGRLVYAVCSIEPEEGVEQIESLLARNPALRRVPLRQARPALAPFESAQGDFFTLPGQEGMDGFFASVLTRK